MKSYVTDDFWNTVELAKEDFVEFCALVKDMTKGELVRFYWGFKEAAAMVHTDPWRSIAYSMTTYTEDSLDDFGNWLVAKGEDFYIEIYENPELLRTIPERDLYPTSVPLIEEIFIEYEKRYKESIPPEMETI